MMFGRAPDELFLTLNFPREIRMVDSVAAIKIPAVEKEAVARNVTR